MSFIGQGGRAIALLAVRELRGQQGGEGGQKLTLGIGDAPEHIKGRASPADAQPSLRDLKSGVQPQSCLSAQGCPRPRDKQHMLTSQVSMDGSPQIYSLFGVPGA